MRNGCGDYRKEMKEEFEKSKSGNFIINYILHGYIILFVLPI